MESSDQKPRGVRTLDDNENIVELSKKIIEETQEMQNVSDLDEMKKEFADIQEVLDYLKIALKITDQELEQLKKIKHDKNGGFRNRIFVKDVAVSEQNKWIDYYRSNPEKYPELSE